MRESLIEKKVCQYAQKKNWLVYKFISPSSKGMPDRIFLKNTFVFFIEFKSKKQKVSEMQNQIILKLTKNNFFVFIVYEVIDGMKIINKMDCLLSEKN